MMKHRSFIKILLYAGFVYFFSMATVHFTGFKVAGLFIYFQIPSYAYQDKIISVLVMGWALFYLQAAMNPVRNLATIRTLIMSGALALFGLCINTVLMNFSLLNPLSKPAYIWIHLALLFVYLATLTYSYAKVGLKVRRGKK